MEDLDRLSDESLELSASEASDVDETTDEEDDDLPNVCVSAPGAVSTLYFYFPLFASHEQIVTHSNASPWCEFRRGTMRGENAKVE